MVVVRSAFQVALAVAVLGTLFLEVASRDAAVLQLPLPISPVEHAVASV